MTSASGLFAHQVAEQTIALLAGIYRGLPTFFRSQQQKEFIRRPTRDLRKATIGIVGLGGNGRRIAEVLSVFQTRILATDVFPWDCPACVEQLWPADQLDELLITGFRTDPPSAAHLRWSIEMLSVVELVVGNW